MVELTVVPTAGETPQMQRRHCEDLRYWSDGIEEQVESDNIFVKRPYDTGHLLVEPDDDVEFGHLEIPTHRLPDIDVDRAPATEQFLIARPDHAKQLERFYV